MSTIPEKLQASKDGLDSLLTYANGVTGQADSNIGDAIKTLCDGYGKGSSGSDYIISGEFVSDYETHTLFIPIQFPFDLQDRFIVNFSLFATDFSTKPDGYVYMSYAYLDASTGKLGGRGGYATSLIYASSSQMGLDHLSGGFVDVSQSESEIMCSTGKFDNRFMAGVPYTYVLVAAKKPIKED